MKNFFILCGIFVLAVFSPVVYAELDAQKRADGIVIDVELPITPQSARVLLRTLQNATTTSTSKSSQTSHAETASTIFLVFRIAAGYEHSARSSSFAASYEVADFLVGAEAMSKFRSVAILPQPLYGHAVLVALACDEVVLAANAEIGDAATDEVGISETLRGVYRAIAQRRRALPFVFIDKMIDSQIAIAEAESGNKTFWGTPQELTEQELSRGEAWDRMPQIIFPAGMKGVYTANESRRYGIVTLLADSLFTAAPLLGIAPESLRRARVVGTEGRVLRVNLTGTLSTYKVHRLMRQMTKLLNEQSQNREEKISLVLLEIDSPGGSINATLAFMDFIIHSLRAKEIRVIAYVPNTALADAALIALASDEIVLGSDAKFGGDGARVFSRKELEQAAPTLHTLLTESMKNPSVALAMIDSEIELWNYTHAKNRSLSRVLSETEWELLGDRDLWTKRDLYKASGNVLELSPQKAMALNLVDRTARDELAFLESCQLDSEPQWLAPGMVDEFLLALADPGWGIVLLLVAMISLSAELKTPGLGLGGFVSLLCFGLFFWGQFLGGTADWLEILLFAIGVIFILAEIFIVPGFGVFGVGGGILVILSVVLAGQTFFIPRNAYQYAQMQWSLLTLLISLGGATIISALTIKLIHNLNRPQETEIKQQAKAELLVDYSPLLGKFGVSQTPLVPAGKVLLGEQLIDVVTDGEFIERGTSVEVISVNGYRVIVRTSQENVVGERDS